MNTEIVEVAKPYQALYRKWRPQTFDDVISQPHIVTTLTNQLCSGKTAHAYLFTGSRGTGKTSCARILAKALNCQNPNGANPCLECENCFSADKNALADLIEIDAASNNSVEDVRELRSLSTYTPTSCKFKIFIIDEVHMLSTSAFNALLKIMEEPPSYVKFILATTEVHKIPATILSRVQRFDFRRILPDGIAARLTHVAVRESFKLEPDAALLIASIADGGMRDALSLLDRCSALTDEISVDTVTNAAGISGRDEIFRLLNAIVHKDTTSAIALVSELYNSSKDITRLAQELILQLRNIMLLQVNPQNSALLSGVLPDEFEKLTQISECFVLKDTIAFLEFLQKCSENLSRTPNKRVEFEMCMVNICSLNRANELNTVTFPSSANTQTPNIQNPGSSQGVFNAFYAAPHTAPGVSLGPPYTDPGVHNISANFQHPNMHATQPQAQSTAPHKIAVSDNTARVEKWEDVLGLLIRHEPACAALLANSYAVCQKDDVITIYVKNLSAKDFFKTESRQKKLKECASTILGKTYRFLIKAADAASLHSTERSSHINPSVSDNAPSIYGNHPISIGVSELLNRAKFAQINVSQNEF